jgi:hypothetical protein
MTGVKQRGRAAACTENVGLANYKRKKKKKKKIVAIYLPHFFMIRFAAHLDLLPYYLHFNQQSPTPVPTTISITTQFFNC